MSLDLKKKEINCKSPYCIAFARTNSRCTWKGIGAKSPIVLHDGIKRQEHM
jgi:hypothetical protein